MTTPKQPRWTDLTRFRRPYADAEATGKPGYLASRFKEIAEQQATDERERQAKVLKIKERK